MLVSEVSHPYLGNMQICRREGLAVVLNISIHHDSILPNQHASQNGQNGRIRRPHLRQKGTSPLGKSVFVSIRAADALLQFSILQRSWGSTLIQRLGDSAVPFAAPRDPTLAYLGLGPYPAIVSDLAVGGSVKYIA